MHDGYFWWMNGNFWNSKQNNTFNLRKTQGLLLPRSEKRIWKQISRQSWLVQSHLESFKSKLSKSNNPGREKINVTAPKQPFLCQRSWPCLVLVSKTLHYGQSQLIWMNNIPEKARPNLPQSIKACNPDHGDHYQRN